MDGVVGQLSVDTKLQRRSCGEEGGCDLGVGRDDELFGAEITVVPAAAGGVGCLSEDVVCGEGVDADLGFVSWKWDGVGIGGSCLLELLGGCSDGTAELGCYDGVAGVAILPFTLVEGLADTTVGVLGVDTEAVVVVHGRDGGVWGRVLACYLLKKRANPLKMISEADIVLGRYLKVYRLVIEYVWIVIILLFLKSSMRNGMVRNGGGSLLL